VAEKIKVGVFWVCDDGENLDIIWDTEEYEEGWVSDFGDEFILYEKTHKGVWKRLSEKFFDGKYACFAYNDFPRGRVSYDSDEEVFMVDCDKVLKKGLSEIKPKIKEYFGFPKALWQPDKQYKSKMGKFNA